MIVGIFQRGIVMRHLLRAMLAAGALAGSSMPAPAQDGPIEGVIQGQVDAFLSGDVETAFGYASPGIKRMFGSPERFGRMVEQGYPMVWRPAEVRYLDRRDLGQGVVQRVMMQDAAGVPWVLEYRMIEGPDGWVIDGVRILNPPELGA